MNGYGDCITKTNTARPPVLSVLYVDDEPVLLEIFKLFLERRPDIFVSTASSVDQAMALLDSLAFDVIISDYQMPGTDGIAFLKLLRANNLSIPFILYTGRGRDEVMEEALANGARFYIQKGGNPRTQFAEIDLKIREAYRMNRPEAILQ